MALKFFKKYRYEASLFLYSFVLIWPVIHIILVATTGISPWRMFGWGMYSVPTAEDQTRVRIVLTKNNYENPAQIKNLYSEIQKLSSDPKQESFCVNVFEKSEWHNPLVKKNNKGLCKEDSFSNSLDRFMSFRSSKDLAFIIHETLNKYDLEGHHAFVFITHQRVDLFQNTAYQESETYHVWKGQVEKQGLIKSSPVINGNIENFTASR